jgi:hypothetical protein
VLNKQLWVLVLRTMIAVGVQNELRVRQVLLEYWHMGETNTRFANVVSRIARGSKRWVITVCPPFTLAPEKPARRSCHKDKSVLVRPVPTRLSVRGW